MNPHVFVIDKSNRIEPNQLLGFMLGFIGFGGTELFRRELTRMMEMMPGGSANPVRQGDRQTDRARAGRGGGEER